MEEFAARGALDGVCSGWLDIFRGGRVRDLLDSALTDILPDVDRLAPEPDKIFEAFRYFQPEKTRVVIVGQDPYPKAGDAVGLCFSSRGRPPSSLRNVFRCLKKSGLVDPIPVFSSVRHWAFQGVLMVNAILTTVVGRSKAHVDRWQRPEGSAVGAILAELDTRVPGIIYLLWGRDARSYAAGSDRSAAGQPVFLHWSHPSPQADMRLPAGSRFEDCPHFLKANELLGGRGKRPVEWSAWAPTRVFTDGACSGNGTRSASARFGLIFTSGPLAGSKIQGLVPGRGLRLERDALQCSADEMPPTNNRAEYLAVCAALLAHKLTESRGKLTIYSDSRLVIKTLTEWYPRRKAAGTEEELKNLDLVGIAVQLIEEIRASRPNLQADMPEGAATVRFIHVHSHEKEPERGSEAYFAWAGNNAADTLATTATCLKVSGSAVLTNMFKFSV